MEDFSFANFEPIFNIAEQDPEDIKKYYKDNSLRPENTMLRNYLNWSDDDPKPLKTIPVPPPPPNPAANLTLNQLMAAAKSITPAEVVNNVSIADKPLYVAPPTKNKTEFLNRYKPEAIKASQRTGIPVNFILAQVANETGWGEHIPGNNFGGIKATKNWTGKKQKLKTTEYHNGKKVKVLADFRVYDTPTIGFQSYVDFLASQKRYKAIKGISDPYQVAEIVSKSGYATDPDYNKKLNIILKQIERIKQ